MGNRVLIVDDSAVLRASVRFALANSGFETEEASNGKQGLDVLKALCQQGKRPDMILTDVNMPVMDGIEFIKQVKQTDHKFVPILVLTTESQDTLKQAGKAAGATGWLVKPFNAEQLVGVVRKFVKA